MLLYDLINYILNETCDHNAQLWIYNILRNYVSVTKLIESHESEVNNVKCLWSFSNFNDAKIKNVQFFATIFD